MCSRYTTSSFLAVQEYSHLHQNLKQHCVNQRHDRGRQNLNHPCLRIWVFQALAKVEPDACGNESLWPDPKANPTWWQSQGFYPTQMKSGAQRLAPPHVNK